VILATPPAALLFCTLFNDSIVKLKKRMIPSERRFVLFIALFLAGASILLEIAAGVQCAFHYNLDLIRPFFGDC
jgi:hypothetical protein